MENESSKDYKGSILARVRAKNGRYSIEVIDNGRGLPKEGRNRLIEPYMTTREKGTGLGLAIVQKITEQHAGTIQLRDAPKRNGFGGGACIRLDFPISKPADSPSKSAGDKETKTKSRKTARKQKQGVTHGV
jgi:two-component system nitrogen regulation sensor histidine kinase NtrY